jgi:hypothetical protein
MAEGARQTLSLSSRRLETQKEKHQMISKNGKPITGARPEMSRKAPFVPDAKETSAATQTMIREAPYPFKNRMTTPNIPAPVHQGFKRDQIAGLPSSRGTQPSSQGGQATRNDVSIHNSTAMTADQLAAIGEKAPSGKGVHSVISGFPTRGASRRK